MIIEAIPWNRMNIHQWIYCIFNDYTPKNGDFFEKNDEKIL